jgi:phospholipid-transporting ATPase
MEEYDFPPWLANMFVFFILFNNMVPISMYIALDIVNLIHSKVIGRDESLQDESGISAKVRSMNLCSELGQIKHLLTDKTGTLTRNEMKLKFCSIAGKIWGRIKSKQFMDPELRTEIKKTDDSVKAQTIMWFLRSIALSHTVMAVTKNKSGAENLCNGEEKENIEGLKNNIRYKAESPDEEALVEGASAMGFQFVGRTSKTISVRIPSVSLRSSNSSNQSLPAFGEDCESDDDDTSLETYKILAMNRFNSTRKRMSVLLQPEKGNAVLLCKGADSTIFPRCKTKDQDIVSKHVDQFSRMGLRTLVVAMREISSDELKIWLKEYNEALHSTQDRDARLERAAETIERDMTVLGASAIEDMLQDKVASCITDIRKAGIKIWVCIFVLNSMLCQLSVFYISLISHFRNNFTPHRYSRATRSRPQSVLLAQAHFYIRTIKFIV